MLHFSCVPPIPSPASGTAVSCQQTGFSNPLWTLRRTLIGHSNGMKNLTRLDFVGRAKLQSWSRMCCGAYWHLAAHIPKLPIHHWVQKVSALATCGAKVVWAAKSLLGQQVGIVLSLPQTGSLGGNRTLGATFVSRNVSDATLQTCCARHRSRWPLVPGRWLAQAKARKKKNEPTPPGSKNPSPMPWSKGGQLVWRLRSRRSVNTLEGTDRYC